MHVMRAGVLSLIRSVATKCVNSAAGLRKVAAAVNSTGFAWCGRPRPPVYQAHGIPKAACHNHVT